MYRRNQALRLLSLGLLGLLRCGPTGGPSVVVDVSGVSGGAGGAQFLRYSAYLNGAAVRASEQVAPSVVELVYPLAEGSAGAFTIEVRAIGNDGCTFAIGNGQVAVAGSERYMLAVSPQFRSPPLCTVDVETSGGGTVTSTPSGLSCGAQCQIEVPSGSNVVLSPTANNRAYFAGWSGACSGSGPCTLTVNRPLSAAAAFYPQLCTTSNVCWENPLPADINLYGIFGTAANNLWAVGDGGQILHYDGMAWSLQASPTTNVLHSIWGSSASDIWAVGAAGTFLHYDGTAWMVGPAPVTALALDVVTGTGPSDVWAAGQSGSLWHYDGTAWTSVASGSVTEFTSLYASSGLVMVGGINGQIFRRNGASFMVQGTNTAAVYGLSGTSDNNLLIVGDSGTMQAWDGSMLTVQTGYPGPNTLRAIYARTATDAWVVSSSDGGVYHFNGSGLARLSSPTQQPLNGVFAIAADNMWAVGARGTILHWNGASLLP